MARSPSLGSLVRDLLVLGPVVGNGVALAQLTAGCTSSSFTTPGWLVENFRLQSSASLIVADFHALNRASGVSLELRCSSSNGTAAGEWHSCSANRTNTNQPFLAAFQTNNNNSAVSFLLNDTWTCNDVNPSKPLTFAAIANNSAPLSCTTDQTNTTNCQSTKPSLLKGSLLTPVKVSPAYGSGPLGHDTKGCTADSRTPEWEVAATQLNLRSVAGSLQSGNAFIILRNDRLGYTASCGGVLTGVAGAQPLSCAGQTAFRRPDKYQIGTSLLFDPKTYALTVNQTWFCDDQDPAQPISITATGTTPLPLECQVFNEETTFCTGGTNGSFSGNITSRALLQPYSLNDPLATAESCTISSVLSPAWWFSAFETNTTTNNTDVVTARFAMELQTSAQSTGNMANIVANGVHYSNTSVATNSSAELPWNKCVIESVGDPALAPTGCEFRYDMASRFLGVKVDWKCSDLDAANPVTFSGEVRTLLPDYNCVTSGMNIRCASPDPAPWRANVTGVTWK